jgi:L,D-peptidoglycan transpeptidase YkuD (ErfK/YbiS/YcfS/YnhG family)
VQVIISHIKRLWTAAGNRRRSAVRVTCATVAILLVGTLATVAFWPHHPLPDVQAARRAARHALRIVRPFAPANARLIERFVALAEVATAAEAASPWWEGSVGRTEAAWFRVVHQARIATTSARAMEGNARKAYTALFPEVRSEVIRAEAEIGEAGMGRREAAAMQRAITGIRLAEKLAAGNRHDQATEELREARRDAAVIHRAWRSLHARFGDRSNLRQWREWAQATIEESRRTGETVLLIDKLRRRVTLYRDGRQIEHFPAELGANGLRRKEHAGDRATPEGMYRVVEIKQAPTTKFHKALLINYPNDEDRMRFALGQRRGLISHRAGIGSLIEIHGDGGEGRDWTDGCIALTNQDMDRLFPLVRLGTAVTIVGTYER